MAAKVPTFFQRWVKPDVYPLIGAMGAALTFCVYSSARTIMFAPDIFVSKEVRANNEGEMCDAKFGESYKHSFVREFVKKHYDVESTDSPHVPASR